MSKISLERFNEIVLQYDCEQKVISAIRKHITHNLILSWKRQVSKCVIMIENKSGKRFFLSKRFRTFEVEFVFWGIPDDPEVAQKAFLHFAYQSVVELSFREFKRWAIQTVPVIKEWRKSPKNIINKELLNCYLRKH